MGERAESESSGTGGTHQVRRLSRDRRADRIAPKNPCAPPLRAPPSPKRCSSPSSRRSITRKRIRPRDVPRSRGSARNKAWRIVGGRRGGEGDLSEYRLLVSDPVSRGDEPAGRCHAGGAYPGVQVRVGKRVPKVATTVLPYALLHTGHNHHAGRVMIFFVSHGLGTVLVWSGQEVVKLSRVGSGRVGSRFYPEMSGDATFTP